MFHKISVFFLSLMFFNAFIFSCEDCIEVLEIRKAHYQSFQKQFDKGSVEHAYFTGAIMEIESCISLYHFNHVDADLFFFGK